MKSNCVEIAPKRLMLISINNVSCVVVIFVLFIGYFYWYYNIIWHDTQAIELTRYKAFASILYFLYLTLEQGIVNKYSMIVVNNLSMLTTFSQHISSPTLEPYRRYNVMFVYIHDIGFC